MGSCHVSWDKQSTHHGHIHQAFLPLLSTKFHEFRSLTALVLTATLLTSEVAHPAQEPRLGLLPHEADVPRVLAWAAGFRVVLQTINRFHNRFSNH